MDVVRTAELCAATSLFTDLGTGQDPEHALRTSLISMRLADAMDLSDDEQSELFYVSLLRFLGCTADATTTSSVVGTDEGAFYAAMAPVNMGSPREQLGQLVSAVAPGAGLGGRLRRLAPMVLDRNGPEKMLLPHCEVGQRLARRMDLPEGVPGALGAAYARWDGTGVPSGLRGELIPRSMRIAIVAREVVLTAAIDRDRVEERLTARRGRSLDPAAVDAACALGPARLVDEMGSADVWEQVLDAEPRPHRVLTGERVRDAAEAHGDFADLKVDGTAGHARGVMALATRAAESLGLGPARTQQLGLAALVHDVGRVGVANTVWSHPGALSTGQWEQVRMHAYYTDRILSRVHGLEDIARLAGSDHERLDGSGYHRGSSDLDAEMRILAAADQFQAMTQTRPHRPALAADAIVDELRSSVRDGTLASRETEAVIGAAVGSAGEVYVERPASLTEREVQVLRLLARGLTNKQVANTLGISPKTVGSHVEHIYAKAGVSTRAAVTLFAIENDLAG